MNIGVISYVNNVRNKGKYLKDVEKFLDIERFYSVFQAKKILEYNRVEYKNILEKETKYDENSSIFSYYVIKAIMMINIDRIVAWCKNNNRNFIRFNNNIINLRSFLRLIREIIKSDNTKKILENRNNILKDNFEGRNLRMSIIEI